MRPRSALVGPESPALIPPGKRNKQYSLHCSGQAATGWARCGGSGRGGFPPLQGVASIDGVGRESCVAVVASVLLSSRPETAPYIPPGRQPLAGTPRGSLACCGIPRAGVCAAIRTLSRSYRLGEGEDCGRHEQGDGGDLTDLTRVLSPKWSPNETGTDLGSTSDTGSSRLATALKVGSRSPYMQMCP